MTVFVEDSEFTVTFSISYAKEKSTRYALVKERNLRPCWELMNAAKISKNCPQNSKEDASSRLSRVYACASTRYQYPYESSLYFPPLHHCRQRFAAFRHDSAHRLSNSVQTTIPAISFPVVAPSRCESCPRACTAIAFYPLRVGARASLS